MKPPLFIVGAEGSGTTLLRLMLNAHPSIAIPPESNFIPEVWKTFQRAQPCSLETLREILGFLETFPSYHDFTLNRASMETRLLALSRPMLSDVLGAVYTAYAEREGKPRWGDKTPGYVEQLHRLNVLFPDCLVIHLIRDARDAVLSMMSRDVGPYTPYEAARKWAGRVSRGRRDGERLLGPSRYLEVYYERLVAEPRETLQRICAFIGEPMDDRMLEFHHDASRHIPAGERYKHEAATRPVTTERVGRWERDMDLLGVLTVQAVAGRLLAAHGYPLKRSPLAGLVSAAVWCRRVAERLWQAPRKLTRSARKRLRALAPGASVRGMPVRARRRAMLSVVIPTRQEAENIAPLLERLARVRNTLSEPLEVLVADSGSRDGTAAIARALLDREALGRVIEAGSCDLAEAVLIGLRQAQGALVGVMDADLSHPPELLPALVDAVRSGSPMAVASRYVAGAGIAEWSWPRRALSRLGRCLTRPLVGVADATSGYFVCRAELIRDLPIQPRGFKILLEILVRGCVHQVREVPYVFTDRVLGASKLGGRVMWRYLDQLGRLYLHRMRHPCRHGRTPAAHGMPMARGEVEPGAEPDPVECIHG